MPVCLWLFLWHLLFNSINMLQFSGHSCGRGVQCRFGRQEWKMNVTTAKQKLWGQQKKLKKIKVSSGSRDTWHKCGCSHNVTPPAPTTRPPPRNDGSPSVRKCKCQYWHSISFHSNAPLILSSPYWNQPVGFSYSFSKSFRSICIPQLMWW